MDGARRAKPRARSRLDAKASRELIFSSINPGARRSFKAGLRGGLGPVEKPRDRFRWRSKSRAGGPWRCRRTPRCRRAACASTGVGRGKRGGPAFAAPSRASRSFAPWSVGGDRPGPRTDQRFYSTTLTLADGRAMTLYGSASKSIEIYTNGVGWDAPIDLGAVHPSFLNHQYYPWTYLLPDGRLFIAGPHVPTHRFDWTNPIAFESWPTNAGDRSTSGEKGTSVLLTLRPPDYEPRVIIAGGNIAGTEDSAEMIDLSQPAPAWTNLPNLNQPRAQQFTSVLLPDGRVFIAGGDLGRRRRWAVRNLRPGEPRGRLEAWPDDGTRANLITRRSSCCSMVASSPAATRGSWDRGPLTSGSSRGTHLRRDQRSRRHRQRSRTERLLPSTHWRLQTSTRSADSSCSEKRPGRAALASLETAE